MPLHEPARVLWIDTDTASDDAVALVIALRRPGLEVAGVSVVAGNLPLQKAVQAALYTREICDAAHVPVHAGVERPMLRQPFSAENVHGSDGMGDIGLELSGRIADPGHAVDRMIEAALARPGLLTLVTLGPLTNVAIALLREPRIAQAFDRCVIMGGIGDGPGNVTPAAEFNIYADPHAARIVLASGMKITLCVWEISCRSAVVEPQDEAALRAIGPIGGFCMDIQRGLAAYARDVSKLAGFDLPDPITVAIAIDPGIATASTDCHVEVVTQEGPAFGQTIVDRKGMLGRLPNVTLIDAASRTGFMRMLADAIG